MKNMRKMKKIYIIQPEKPKNPVHLDTWEWLAKLINCELKKVTENIYSLLSNSNRKIIVSELFNVLF